MPKYVMRVNSDSFDLKECKKNCGCYIDPLKTLIEGYKILEWEKFENCLKSKWSIGDCVVGCHNEIYNETDSTNRNAHQRRVSKILIARLIEALKLANDFIENPKDFETIYNWVAKYVEIVRADLKAPEMEDDDDFQDEEDTDISEDLSIHICPLLKYDTALRMAYNMEGADRQLIPSKDNECLPKNYVYLQRGALLGARALLKISLLSQREANIFKKRKKYILKPYLTLKSPNELDGPCIIEMSHFNADLQDLGSYHVENFLCIYHQLLTDWANGYEIRVENLEWTKKTNTNKL